jgi:hypothetical protein
MAFRKVAGVVVSWKRAKDSNSNQSGAGQESVEPFACCLILGDPRNSGDAGCRGDDDVGVRYGDRDKFVQRQSDSGGLIARESATRPHIRLE